LRPETGEYVWHYQTTPGDSWDFTATQHIIVATLPIDGKPRRVVMQAPKNGFFYVLDAATGDLISAGKYGEVNWAKGIDMEIGRPIVNDEIAKYWIHKKPVVVFPGSQGAHNWPPMSFNPDTGLVYIPQQVTMEHFDPVDKPNPIKTGVPNLGINVPRGPMTVAEARKVNETYRGNLVAWDPVKQEARWTVPYSNIHNGGTLSTAGNLVFQGTADGRVVAYAADSGEKLWEQEVSTGVVAAPITYSVGGEQYVAFNAGWGGAFPITFGALSRFAGVLPDSRLYVFKLNGKAELPEVHRMDWQPPTPPPLTADAATVEEGEVLFRNHCGVCHGLEVMGGTIIPDLRYMSKQTHDEFLAILAGLRSNKGMPPFIPTQLTLEQGESIHQYIIKRAHDLREEMTGKTADKSNPSSDASGP
jgi:quinohemoprotein ethanol dehydrogenase